MNGGYSDKKMKKICDKVEKWYELFTRSKHFEELTPEQKYESDFIITTFTEYMYSYHLLAPEEWDEECLEDCCTEILPRKISAGESYFRSVAPVLSSFLRFAEEKGLLRNTSDLVKRVKEIDKQIIENAADPRNWGMAKSFVMAAMDAGVDITDEEELDRYLTSYNLLQAQDRSKGGVRGKHKIGRNEPCPCGSGKKYKKCCLKKDLSRENEPLQEAGLSPTVGEGLSLEMMPELDPETTLGDLFDIKCTEIKDDETKELLLYHIQTGNCPYNKKECTPQICPLGEEGINQCTFH